MQASSQTADGIAAMKAGEKDRARQLLSAALAADPGDATAWLWLSAAVSDPAERRYCLQQVLLIHPGSPAATKGMATLGAGEARSPLRAVEVVAPEPPPVVVAPVAAAAAPIVVAVPPLAAVEAPAKERRKGIGLGRFTLIVVGILVVVFGGLIALQPLAPGGFICRYQAYQYGNQIQPLVQEWSDGLQLAGSTSRVALPTQISSLQEIRRRVGQISPPGCAATAHKHLLQSMDSGIAGLIAFLGQEPDTKVQGLFSTASSNMSAFKADIEQLAGSFTSPAALPTVIPTQQFVLPTSDPRAEGVNAYSAQVMPARAQIRDALPKLTELILAPRPQLEWWKSDIRTQLQAISKADKTILATQPASVVAAVHTAFSAAASECEQGVDLFTQGIEKDDVVMIKQARALFDSCSAKADTAVGMLDKLRP